MRRSFCDRLVPHISYYIKSCKLMTNVTAISFFDCGWYHLGKKSDDPNYIHYVPTVFAFKKNANKNSQSSLRYKRYKKRGRGKRQVTRERESELFLGQTDVIPDTIDETNSDRLDNDKGK